MKAVQIVSRGNPVFVDVPEPEVKTGYALVRTHRLSLCGSDIQWLHYLTDNKYPTQPGTTGHEMVGYVEKLGSPHPHIKEGDVALVLAPNHQAMAEYYLAPVDNILLLPSGKPVEHFLQAQQVGTVVYACKYLPNVIGKDVAVIGQGSAGLWFDFMLRRMGARRVIAVDLQAHRLEVATIYGVTHTIHNIDTEPIEAIKAITGGELADVVIEAAGEVESINLAIDLAKDFGFILYFGVPRKESFEFNFMRAFKKRLKMHGVVYASLEPEHRSTRLALDWIASGELDVSPILTHRFSFENVFQAYNLQNMRDQDAIKIIVEM